MPRLVSSPQNPDFVRIKIEATTLHRTKNLDAWPLKRPTAVILPLLETLLFVLRGLAIRPFGNRRPNFAVVTAFAFGLFFVQHEKRRIISSLSAFGALFWTAIAFIIDFALYSQVASAMGKTTSN
ncbi:hypothetical protein C8J57DRAFT_1256636 [Mycena rebaudengoi]|nr:hypothetical protein C8J57DRAFT_1256636 [Mycena rebaudengoi]